MPHLTLQLLLLLLLVFMIGCILGCLVRSMLRPKSSTPAKTAQASVADVNAVSKKVPKAEPSPGAVSQTKPEPEEMAASSVKAAPATKPASRKPATPKPAVKKAAEAVSTGKPKRPKGLPGARGGKPDKLQMISGVGPKLEKTLHGLGFFHFDQIAGWGTDQIAWVDEHLRFKGRIERDQWIAQCKLLAADDLDQFNKLYGTGSGKTASQPKSAARNAGKKSK